MMGPSPFPQIFLFLSPDSDRLSLNVGADLSPADSVALEIATVCVICQAP